MLLQPAAGYSAPAPSATIAASIAIPEQLGIVDDSYIGSPDQPTIIHIQDAHAQPEAQRSIEKILISLAEQKAISRVGVEAAFYPLDTSFLKPTETPEVNTAFAEKLTDLGELTGAERFALRPESQPVVLMGVEDLELYFQSLDIFKKLKNEKTQWVGALQQNEKTLQELSRKKLNAGLRNYLNKKLHWENGADEAFSYLYFLIDQAAETLGWNFSDAAMQFESPHLTRIAALREIEKHYKPELAQEQMLRLKEIALAGSGTFYADALDALMAQKDFKSWLLTQNVPSELKTPRRFFEGFYEFLSAQKIQMLSFPDFLNCAGLVLLRDEIDPTALLREIKKLEPAVEKKLYRTREEKQTAVLIKRSAILNKLHALELNREDYAYYLKHKNQFSAEAFTRALKQQGTVRAFEMPEVYTRLAERFYALSVQRDVLLAERITALAQKGPSDKAVVLITGGFHSGGIRDYLKARHISYLSILPKMTSLHAKDFYENIMTGKNLKSGYLELLKKQHLGAVVLAQKFPKHEVRFEPTALRRENLRMELVPDLLRQAGYDDKIINKIINPPAAEDVQKTSHKTQKSSVPPLEFGILSLGWTAAQIWNRKAPARSEIRGLPLDLTDLAPEEELKVLRQWLEVLQKEKASPGSQILPRLIMISDEHGAIEKFDALIIDSMRRIYPEKIPAGFQLNHFKPMEDQLAALGVNLQDDFDGKWFLLNLGDFMDRGDYGIAVALRSMELVNAGLSKVVQGNHDYYVLFNLMGFHLPFYKGYKLYDYKDRYDQNYGNVEDLLKRAHATMPSTMTKSWWAVRLADYTAFHKKKQEEFWKDLEIKVNGKFDKNKKRMPGTGLFAQVSASLNGNKENAALWNQFRGWNLVDVYTGVRDVGGVSVVWWENLLKKFETAYAQIQKEPGFDASLPSNQAWQEAIRMMQQDILPVLKKDLEDHFKPESEGGKGEWWWRVFEAINAQNYTSPEWLVKDWLFHEGWGTQVLKELNAHFSAAGKVITPANYLDNVILDRFAQFARNNFTFFRRDLYQNTSAHSFFPVDMQTGEFYYKLRGKEYRGKGSKDSPSVWEGFKYMEKEIRNHGNSMKDLHDIISLVLTWYGDNTTVIKPKHVAAAVNKFGPERLAEVNGFNRFFSGHLPFFEFAKLAVEALGIITGWLFRNSIGITDHGTAEKFGNRGAYVEFSSEVKLRGYEHAGQAINQIVDHPRTVKTAPGTDAPVEEVMFQNPGIPRDIFLPKLIVEVEARIQELEKETRSEAREIQVLPDNLQRFLAEKLGVQYSSLNPAERETYDSLEVWLRYLNNSSRWFELRQNKLQELFKGPGAASGAAALAAQMLESGYFEPLAGNNSSAENYQILDEMKNLIQSLKIAEKDPLYELFLSKIRNFLSSNPNEVTLIYAADALGELGGKSVFPDLFQMYSLKNEHTVRQRAYWALRRHARGAANYAVKVIKESKQSWERQLAAEFLDKTELSTEEVLHFFIKKPENLKRALQLFKNNPINVSSWLSSALFVDPATRQPGKIKQLLEKIETFQDEIGKKNFDRLIEFWGVPMVSNWATQPNLDRETLLWAAGLERKQGGAISSPIVEAIEAAYASSNPFLLRPLLLLIIQGKPEILPHHFQAMLRLVAKDPVKGMPLALFLITHFKLSPIAFRENQFVQNQISLLLHSAWGNHYYYIRKLAAATPHAAQGSQGLDEKIRLLANSLDASYEGRFPLFHVLRLEIHRKASKYNYDFAKSVQEILEEMAAGGDPAERIENMQLYIQMESAREKAAGTFKEQQEELRSLAEAVKELRQTGFNFQKTYQELQNLRLVDTISSWPADLSGKQQTLLRAKVLLTLVEGLSMRYVLQPAEIPAQVKEAEDEKNFLGAIEQMLEERNATKNYLAAPMEFNPQEFEESQQAKGPHDAWGFYDHYGYEPYGLKTSYREAKFDRFENDRALEDYLTGLHSQFLQTDFRRYKEAIESWAERNPQPARRGGPLPDPALQPLKKMVDGLTLLIRQMRMDGLANQRFENIERIISQDNINLYQLSNLIDMLKTESDRIYDFINFNFSDFADALAQNLEEDNLLPAYRNEKGKLPPEVIRESLLVDIWSQERAHAVLETYLKEFKDLLNSLKSWRTEYYRSFEAKKADGYIATSSNYQSGPFSQANVGSKAYENFQRISKGFPIPPQVTLTADLPFHHPLNSKNKKFRTLLMTAILELEKETGKIFPFGEMEDWEMRFIEDNRLKRNINPNRPILLLSARSGAIESMPGVMHTVLDLPLTRKIIKRLIKKEKKDPRFVWDSYRRFLSSFATAVYGESEKFFSLIIDLTKADLGKNSISEFTAQELEELSEAFLEQIFQRHPDFKKIHNDPFALVLHSVSAIYDSWSNESALKHRERFGIAPDWGTAVTLQQMVFGNLDSESGTGVVFTSDPDSGQYEPHGTWKDGAQGQDLVGGLVEIYTPIHNNQGKASLQATNPELFHELRNLSFDVQRDAQSPMDMEITRESKKLWLLQSRPLAGNGKKSKKYITADEDYLKTVKRLGVGEPASPNAAVGRLIDARRLDAEMLEKEVTELRAAMDANGENDLDIILIFDYVTADEAALKLGIPGVSGLINSKIGISTHASLAARRYGLAYVSNLEIDFDDEKNKIRLGNRVMRTGIEGDILSIDGYSSYQSQTSGHVYLGTLPVTVEGSEESQNAKPAFESRGPKAEIEEEAVDVETILPAVLQTLAQGEFSLYDKYKDLILPSLIRNRDFETLSAFQELVFRPRVSPKRQASRYWIMSTRIGEAMEAIRAKGLEPWQEKELGSLAGEAKAHFARMAKAADPQVEFTGPVVDLDFMPTLPLKAQKHFRDQPFFKDAILDTEKVFFEVTRQYDHWDLDSDYRTRINEFNQAMLSMPFSEDPDWQNKVIRFILKTASDFPEESPALLVYLITQLQRYGYRVPELDPEPLFNLMDFVNEGTHPGIVYLTRYLAELMFENNSGQKRLKVNDPARARTRANKVSYGYGIAGVLRDQIHNFMGIHTLGLLERALEYWRLHGQERAADILHNPNYLPDVYKERPRFANHEKSYYPVTVLSELQPAQDEKASLFMKTLFRILSEKGVTESAFYSHLRSLTDLELSEIIQQINSELGTSYDLFGPETDVVSYLWVYREFAMRFSLGGSQDQAADFLKEHALEEDQVLEALEKIYELKLKIRPQMYIKRDSYYRRDVESQFEEDYGVVDEDDNSNGGARVQDPQLDLYRTDYRLSLLENYFIDQLNAKYSKISSADIPDVFRFLEILTKLGYIDGEYTLEAVDHIATFKEKLSAATFQDVLYLMMRELNQLDAYFERLVKPSVEAINQATPAADIHRFTGDVVSGAVEQRQYALFQTMNYFRDFNRKTAALKALLEQVKQANVQEVLQKKPYRDTDGIPKYMVLGPNSSPEELERALTMGRYRLSAKGIGIIRALQQGIPVPPFIIFSSELDFESIKALLPEALKKLNQAIKGQKNMGLGSEFAEGHRPYFLSVRNGFYITLPGLMDTVTNTGMDREKTQQFAERLTLYGVSSEEAEWTAWDSYRRFLQEYGVSVLGKSNSVYDEIIENEKERLKISSKEKFSAKQMKDIALKYEEVSTNEGKIPLGRPDQQLHGTIDAVMRSYEKAGPYLKTLGLKGEWPGTALMIQAMSYGNMRENSGAGVISTRDPATWHPRLMGDFKWAAQGSDIAQHNSYPVAFEHMGFYPWKNTMQEWARRLEGLMAGNQEIEFTVQMINGESFPWLLQTRDFSVPDPAPYFDAEPRLEDILVDEGEAIGISGGAFRGMVIYSLKGNIPSLQDLHDQNLDGVILLASVLEPGQVPYISEKGVKAAITSRGGSRSHTADISKEQKMTVVARVKGLEWDEGNKVWRLDGRILRRGQILSIDGRTGRISRGTLPIKNTQVQNRNGNGKTNGNGNGQKAASEVKKSESRSESRFFIIQEEKTIRTQTPAQVVLNLGAYRINKKGQQLDDLRSTYDSSQKVAANTVNNRVVDAFLRAVLGDPNISVTDIYGVEDAQRFFSNLTANVYHGRYAAEELKLQKQEEGLYLLTVNGYVIRIHTAPAGEESFKPSGVQYLIDFSDPDLTGESPAQRKARLLELQKNNRNLRVFNFSPDDDPEETVLVPGMNVAGLPEKARYHAIASPLTLAVSQILRVVQTEMPEEFEMFSSILGARPVTGDSGNIQFLGGKTFGSALRTLFPNLASRNPGAKAGMLEYSIEKGAGSSVLSLIPAPKSKLKAVADQLKKLKKETIPEKEKESRRKQIIYEAVNQFFERASETTLKGYLRYAGEEHLSSLTALRDRSPVVFDSQATDILENGQVELYFHMTDLGYGASLNKMIQDIAVQDLPPADVAQTADFQNNLSNGIWREGTIPPNRKPESKKRVAEGDEIAFGIVGVRGRIGKLLHKLLTSNPNYRPVFWLGVQDIDTLIQQFKEDPVQGPMTADIEGMPYEIEKNKSHDGVILKNKITGEYFRDSRDPQKPLVIPYYHIQKRAGEDEEGFERRIRETLNSDLDEIETLFNAAGFGLDKKDPYYRAFQDGKKLKRIMMTAPAKGEVDITVVRGVNENDLVSFVEKAAGNVLFCSAASCTTTGLGRILMEYNKYLESQGLEVEYLRFITHHSITPSQGNIHGAPSAGKSLRTANDPTRGAALEATGANKVVVQVRPQFKGKLSGVSHRDGNYGSSLLRISALVRKKPDQKVPSAEEVNLYFQMLSKTPQFHKVIGYGENIQSTAQITGDETVSLFVPSMTLIEDGKNAAVLSISVGYDNEFGYSNAVVHIDELAGLAQRRLVKADDPEALSDVSPSEEFLKSVAGLAVRLHEFKQHSAETLKLSTEKWNEYKDLMGRLVAASGQFNSTKEPKQFLTLVKETAGALAALAGNDAENLLMEIAEDLENSHDELERDFERTVRGELRALEMPMNLSPSEQWVILHMARGLLALEHLNEQDARSQWAYYFFREERVSDGMVSVNKKNQIGISDIGLDISVVERTPSEEDPIYFGIAKVLLEQPHRHIRLVILNGDPKETEAMNLAFLHRFGHFTDLRGRFRIEAASTLNFQKDLETIIQQARFAVQKHDGVTQASILKFYEHVSLSSADADILNSVHLPLGWKVLNDLEGTPALQTHLIRRKLELSQGLLKADRIRHLGEIQKERILSASAALFAGEDLSQIADLFNEAFRQRQVQIAA